jgi:hypothetical protein
MHVRSLIISFLFIVHSLIAVAQNEIRPDTLKTSIDNADPTFEKVDIEASFPGGDAAWRKFLEKNLRGDVATENGAPAGIYTVLVQFIVDKEGNLSDIKPLTHWGYGMEKEVLRLIVISPRWSPASRNGRALKAYRKQPVTFMIEEQGLEVYPNKGYVLYIGMDNPITVNALKAKDKNLRVTISQGTITGSDNSYIARVTTEGRAVIEVYNKNKKLGAVSLEVKPKPSSSEIKLP